MIFDEPTCGRRECYLCTADAFLLMPHPDRLVERIYCPYCGKYGISVIVIELEVYRNKTRAVVSGKVFDSYFYNKKEKIIETADFDVKDIAENEKLFRLAKYFYTATKRGIELKANPASCYEFNSRDFCGKMNTLKRKGLIEYEQASKFDDSGDYASHFFEIRMSSEAITAFENGINTPEDFEKAFMDKDKSGGIVYFNSQHIEASGSASVTAVQNNASNMAELQPLLDQLFQAVPQNTPQEQIRQIKECIETIQAEMQSPALRTGVIKTILSGLAGVIRTAEFAAALAALAQAFGISLPVIS
jgi:hypothetical protein